METSDLATLRQIVLGASFVLSALFGAVAQHTRFCTMGAISDLVNLGDGTRMRQWGLAAGVAMLGFAALGYTGAIDPSKVLYSTPRWLWLSAALGGTLFGAGMVLASGCVSKSVVRVGSGNLKSLVVLLVMGIAAFATLKGVTAVVRVNWVDVHSLALNTPADLPSMLASWLGASLPAMRLLLGLAGGAMLCVWALRGEGFLRAENLIAGGVSGALVVALWWVSGHLGYVAENPETLEELFVGTQSGRAESLSFVAPVAYLLDWLMFFSDTHKVLTLGIVSVLGLGLGSALAALAGRTFRWEGFRNTDDLAHHLVGAVLMGVGGVTAMGCSIGQGLSGLSTLNITSLEAVLAMGAGAVLALRYQMWRLERQS